jgi:VanZ family protein
LLVRKGVLTFWILVILFLSLFPFSQNTEAKWWAHTDKLVHLVLYFVLTVLTMSVLQGKNSHYSAFIYCVTFGIVVEALQAWMGLGRSFSFYDILANTTGVCLGLTGYYLVKKLKFGQAQ